MKTTAKFITLPLLLVGMSLMCTTCEKEEDYNAITYYDAVGEGYVFMCDSAGNILYPIYGAEVQMTTIFDGDGGWIGTPRSFNVFYTDANGKYQVRFIKRTKRDDAVRYEFWIVHTPEDSGIGKIRSFSFSVDDIKTVKIAESPAGQYVYFQQYLNDIPIFATNFIVFVSNENVVRYALNEFRDVSKYKNIGIIRTEYIGEETYAVRNLIKYSVKPYKR